MWSMASRSVVMVGREPELAQLLGAFARADAGEAQVALVTGEAGIGKTRLVNELVASLPDEAVVSFSHAVPLSGGALPYGVAADLLRSLVREVGPERVREALGESVRVLAPLVPRLSSGQNQPVDRLAVFAATQELLLDLSTRMCLILVVEDAHWADVSSLDLIRFWARTVTKGRIFLLVTSREDESVAAREVLAELRRAQTSVPVVLSPLSGDSLRDQVRGLDRDLSPEAVEGIGRLSGGIPLYVEELVAAGEGRAMRLVSTDLSTRLRTLEADVVRLLQVASVEPRPFDVGALAEVSGASSDAVAHAVDVAVARGLLDSEEGRWRFHHELLRRAAEDSMSPSQRLAAHRSWAVVLEKSRSPGDLVSGALHRREADGANRETFLALTRAAAAVDHVASAGEARRLWHAAAEVACENPEAASEEEHGAVLGAAVTVMNNPVPLRELLESEDRSAKVATGERGLFLRALRWSLAGWHPTAESPPISSADLAAIRGELEATPPSRLSVATLLLLVDGLVAEGRNVERDDLVDLLAQHEAYVDAEAGRRRQGPQWSLFYRLRTMSGLGREDERLALIRAEVESSRDGDWVAHSWLRATLAGELVDAGRSQEGLEEARRAVRLVPDTTEEAWYYAAEPQIDALVLLGLWDEVLGLAGPLRRRGTLDGHWWKISTYQVLIADARGETDLARELAQEMRSAAFPVATDVHTRENRFLADFAAASLSGATAEDLARLVQHLDHLDPDLFWFVPAAVTRSAELAWRTADKQDLGSVRRALAAPSRSTLVRCWQFEGVAHLARANGDDSPQTWQSAVDAWDKTGNSYRSALARLRWAELLLGGGDRQSAASALTVALDAAESLRAGQVIAQVRTLAGRARLRLATNQPEPDGGPLTPREHEVLQLLVRGMTNDQIGTSLFMSPRTASVHVSHILAKLGASNRTEVAAIAHARGLVGSD
jgi:DNA-binding CsgD family transcriptional regulator